MLVVALHHIDDAAKIRISAESAKENLSFFLISTIKILKCLYI